MKKDILENVYYRLKDEHEVKLSILYSIKYAGIPVSDTEIKHFMLDATSVSFVDLCINLTSLLDGGYLKSVWRDEIEKYDLTEQGLELIEMFSDKIMVTVRESLRKSIDEYFGRDADGISAKRLSLVLEDITFNNLSAVCKERCRGGRAHRLVKTKHDPTVLALLNRLKNDTAITL